MFETVKKNTTQNTPQKNFFGNNVSLSFFGPGIQRQPTKDPPKKEDQSTPPAKTLSEQGISAGDPAFGGAAQKIDDAFARNKRFAKYLAEPLASGKPIAGKGKFIIHPTKQTYQDALKAYEKNRTGGGGDAEAFYWESEASGKTITMKQEIHLSPSATFGTAFHEAVHKMSFDITAQLRDDASLAFDVNEGLTSWFSKEMLKDEGVSDYTDGYPFQRGKAGDLIKSFGLDAIGTWYFTGNASELRRLLKIKRDDNLASKLKPYW